MRVMLDHCTPATTRHHLPDHQVSTAALMSWQGGSALESHQGTPNWSPFKPAREPQPAQQSEPDWGGVSASPAGVGLQAPVLADTRSPLCVHTRLPTVTVRAVSAPLPPARPAANLRNLWTTTTQPATTWLPRRCSRPTSSLKPVQAHRALSPRRWATHALVNFARRLRIANVTPQTQ